MNLSSVKTKEYENEQLLRPPRKQTQNKPNQTQTKPNFRQGFSPLPLVDRADRSYKYTFLTSKGVTSEKAYAKTPKFEKMNEKRVSA